MKAVLVMVLLTAAMAAMTIDQLGEVIMLGIAAMARNCAQLTQSGTAAYPT